MFIRRLIISIIFIPLILLVIYFGKWPFLFLIEGIIVLGLMEFYQLLINDAPKLLKLAGIVIGVILSLFFYYAQGQINWVGNGQILGLFISFFIILLFLSKILSADVTKGIKHIAFIVLGIFYISWLTSHILLLRELTPWGREYTYYLFFMIWTIDTAAYGVGMKWGRHRLAPVISPHKSKEGAIAGFVAAVFFSLICRLWFLPQLKIKDALILGISLGIVAQISDLGESLIKRYTRVKDTGEIIPGHGGVLDRFDSLFFSAPFLYYYVVFLL